MISSFVTFDAGARVLGRGGGSFKITSLFFDKKYVMRSLDKQTRTVFAKFGAYVRNAARWSMKPAPKDKFTTTADKKIRRRRVTSRPGQPPFSRTGVLKKFIYYSLDPMSRSVVIGPMKTNKRGDVPHVLEYGGMTTLLDGITWEKKRVRVAARPYMTPAFEKGVKQLPALWKNSVK